MIQPAIDPDLSKDIESLAAELFEDPQAWLDAPHPMFGGETPREIAKTHPAGEQLVRGLLRSLKHGVSP